MSHLEINKKWCKGCAICVEFCPKQVLGISEEKVTVVNADACIKCRLCEYRCPDFAIFVKEEVEA